ncbi:Phosphatidylglycerophosphate synthase [Planctomycetales bacterium 10988]|nr:Phosphatidylglycerophosphate synthase [Planctomycetales bacterium 10988]
MPTARPCLKSSLSRTTVAARFQRRWRLRQRQWRQFEARCQKPGHRTHGSWMARRIARPVGLYLTACLIPLGVTAHQMTCVALVCGWSSAFAFAVGGESGWLWGAALLQLWYLLDHVDGQLARYHQTSSLDGVAFDYWMHHLVNFALPLGIGYGLFQQWPSPLWLLAGVTWSGGLLAIGFLEDVRYKAFLLRLKRIEGKLLVQGGGNRHRLRPAMQPATWVGRGKWLGRKLCETHIMMNVLTVIAGWWWLTKDFGKGGLGAMSYVAFMATWTPLVAGYLMRRSLQQCKVETEFAAWYQPFESNKKHFLNAHIARHEETCR